MIILVLIGVGAVAAIVGVEHIGRALGSHAEKRWPYLAGFVVCFGLGVEALVGPVNVWPISGIPLLSLLLLIVSFVCLRALLSIDGATTPVEEWAEAHGVAVSRRNAGFVTHYVVQGHRLRLVCGFGGVVVAAALSAGTGVHPPADEWVWLLGGYLAGVVWSESWLTRLPGGTQRVASLKRRILGDYLPRFLRFAPTVAACCTTAFGGLVLAAGGGRVLRRDGWASVQSASSASLRHDVIGIAVAGLVLTGGVWLLQLHVIRKPQPLDDPDLLAADDAVRASAVHLLSTTTVAILLVLIWNQLQMLDALGLVPRVAPLFGWMILLPVAFIIWRYFGHRRWIVASRTGGQPGRVALEAASP